MYFYLLSWPLFVWSTKGVCGCLTVFLSTGKISEKICWDEPPPRHIERVHAVFPLPPLPLSHLVRCVDQDRRHCTPSPLLAINYMVSCLSVGHASCFSSRCFVCVCVSVLDPPACGYNCNNTRREKSASILYVYAGFRHTQATRSPFLPYHKTTLALLPCPSLALVSFTLT